MTEFQYLYLKTFADVFFFEVGGNYEKDDAKGTFKMWKKLRKRKIKKKWKLIFLVYSEGKIYMQNFIVYASKYCCVK